MGGTKEFVDMRYTEHNLYYVACVEFDGKGRYWEVINNNAGTIIAAIDDHDKAHELAKALTTATLILLEQGEKDKQ